MDPVGVPPPASHRPTSRTPAAKRTLWMILAIASAGMSAMLVVVVTVLGTIVVGVAASADTTPKPTTTWPAAAGQPSVTATTPHATSPTPSTRPSDPATIEPEPVAEPVVEPEPEAPVGFAEPVPVPVPDAEHEPEPAPIPVPDAPTAVYYENCDAARADGAAPLYVGDPGYRPGLDRDRDGIACE